MNQGGMLSQIASLEVTSIRNLKNYMENPSVYFIDFEIRINIESFTSNQCHRFEVNYPLKINEISTNFRHAILMSNR